VVWRYPFELVSFGILFTALVYGECDHFLKDTESMPCQYLVSVKASLFTFYYLKYNKILISKDILEI